MTTMPPLLLSAGMSCQTTHQLRRLAGAGRTRTVSTPFDWLIAPARRLAHWVEAGLPDFSPGDIVAERGRAYWPLYGIWFWHGFLDGPKGARHLDIGATFEREREKLAHQRRNLRRAGERGAQFVVSNLQNNLEGHVFAPHEMGLAHLDGPALAALQEALEGWLDRDVVLHALTRADRSDPHAPGLRRVPPGDSEWKGDDTVWDRFAASLSAGS